MNSTRVTGIVLAAGLSQRMGQPKQLLKLGSQTLLSQVMLNAIRSKLDQVIVVVSPQIEQQATQILESLDKKVLIVVNTDPVRGISSSIKLGLEEVSEGARGVMVLLGDQPLVSTEIIDKLIDTFDLHPKKIIVPTYNGKDGNPVIFPAESIGDLRTISGDKGAKNIIYNHLDLVIKVEVGDLGSMEDIDTPEDYKNILARFMER
ncbi:4-diphosphocytidyl-2C-methyl-D-erythritol synthase [Thermobaculum terrenum ATCC BAA-798]|uniref:4-diphosphocytidyl-2C-methyl-D-erythritol synthase n=1 Tax=Thermobaculum terrenum (strain ATCC BAA-798 / CCMEE 7001 / YNP1) TaxID=525904 RepID=D1CC06_THET1|nr:nucleotidyltransferase family protein [Thermobaculum terrenum]ACZ42321.1 4-diphosphocytidyl-2C-methyl-D-erythritol synthase [Thermobaculum terrenum ATCC BAA-798]